MTDQYESIEIKAFVPAKDYNLSKEFYTDAGFTIQSDSEGIAYVNHGKCSFLLQDFYNKEMANNLMISLLVSNVEAWHQRLINANITEKYGIVISEPVVQPWKMKDFTLYDPSGVLWRIGQNE